MNTDQVANLGLIISLVSTVIALMSAYFSRKSFEESRNSTYLQVFEIIKRHHSSEITNLRKAVLKFLDKKCAESKAINRSLEEYDTNLHEKASELANYYEALGMFIQGGWHYFPKQVKDTLLEMLHNSVTNTWLIYKKHKPVIYTGESPDWSKSYEWLYDECQVYRKNNGLTKQINSNK